MKKKNLLYFIKKPVLKKLKLVNPLLENKIKLLDEIVSNSSSLLRRTIKLSISGPATYPLLNTNTSLTVSLKFTISNTLVSATTSSGDPLISFSAGLVGLKSRQKVDRQKAVTSLLIKMDKHLRNIGIDQNVLVSLHLTNIGQNTRFVVGVAKLLFLIVSVKSLERTPFNGCRKKKLRRKKTVSTILR